MNIHEYQAKVILAKHGLFVQKGGVAFSAAEAKKIAEDLGGDMWVLKAQIHAGGRGKAGGVKLFKNIDELKDAAGAMLGSNLVTLQTGPAGQRVSKVYIESACQIDKEYYLSMLVNRKNGMVTLIASSDGGVSIEEVAANNPDAVHSIAIDPAIGIYPYHARLLAYKLGLNKSKAYNELSDFLFKLYDAFITNDASMIEINPLVVTKSGDLVVLDAKMTFDDNALFRHNNLIALRDLSEEDPMEIEAADHGLSYVKLDGSIGCMVNGAGLAMATMDIIKLHGGEPANFLDVGGGASKEKVAKAFSIIGSDPNVKAILVNIFGGIMRCDIIADGVISAIRQTSLKVPLVVRLAGTNVDLGNEMFANSGLPIVSAFDLADAADKVVQATKGR